MSPPIEAVILDFAMPGMNGASLAREIRSRRPSLPILFATGYADTDALASTPDDRIILKPFEQAELAEKLSRALLATAGRATPVEHGVQVGL